MTLAEKQSRELFRRTGSYLTEACDRCGKPLAEVRYTRRGEPGEWCSEICRDGRAAVHTRQVRRAGRPRLKLSAKGRVLHRRMQIREAAQRHRLGVIKNGQQPIDDKPVTDAFLRSGYLQALQAQSSPILPPGPMEIERRGHSELSLQETQEARG